MKVALLVVALAALILLFLVVRRYQPASAPSFSGQPEQAEADVRLNIGLGEYRLPVVAAADGLRYAPFLGNAVDYTAVNGGHVLLASNYPKGVALDYANRYWTAYLPALKSADKLHEFEARKARADALRSNPTTPGSNSTK